jgi:excisionase family DNA binding protein
MKIYKITGASEYLGVSINTLKTLANNNKINSFKTSGGHRRFRQDDLDAYMGIEKDKQEKLTVKKQEAWTQSEIDILIEKGSELFLHELVDLIPRHSPVAIGAKKNRLGITSSEGLVSKRASINRNKRNDSATCIIDDSLTLNDFNNAVRQCLVGSILGDGCVTKPTKRNCNNYHFSETHYEKQIEYCKWKANFLKDFYPRVYPLTKKCQIVTPSHPIFTEIRNAVYKNDNKHRLPLDLFGELDEFGLLIWYLDDGGKYGRAQSITSKLFNVDDLTALIIHINKNLGTGLYVKDYPHNGGLMSKIVISAKDRDFLFPIWNKLFDKYGIPENMRYKIS